MPIEFGNLAPCRACHGAGERRLAMTKDQKREHERERLRILRNDPDGIAEFDRVSVIKPCPDCDGKGYVPPIMADVPYFVPFDPKAAE